jgi:hypothetical protein
MASSQHEKDVVFAKALDYIKAQVSPNDGGVTEAAVEILRDHLRDPSVAAKLHEKLGTKEEEAVVEPAPAPTPANPGRQPAKQPQRKNDVSPEVNTPAPLPAAN